MFLQYCTKSLRIVKLCRTLSNMNLKDYFSSRPYGSKVELAKKLGITKTWMSQLISGREKCSPSMAVKIEQMTDGVVTRADMRPDLFGV